MTTSRVGFAVRIVRLSWRGPDNVVRKRTCRIIAWTPEGYRDRLRDRVAWFRRDHNIPAGADIQTQETIEATARRA